MTTYTNKKGAEILVDNSGWKISRDNYNRKLAQNEAMQKARKVPQSLLNELESAKIDGESADYIAHLESKIAKYN